MEPPKTPPKPTSSQSSQTPISFGSGILSGTEVSSAVIAQEKQIKLLEVELEDAARIGDENWFKILTDAVAKADLAKLSRVYVNDLSQYGWPPKTVKKETDYYPPIATWLNKIGDEARDKLEKKSTYFSWDLQFFVYDREVVHQSNVKLKPDLLGWLGGVRNIPAGQVVSWKDVHILVEVKLDHPTDLFYQTSTYARAIFSHQHDRLWVYAILINGRTSGAFARFDRSGAISTENFNLDSPEGREHFVKGVLALMQLDALEFGVDLSFDGKRMRILDDDFDVKEVLCYREGIRGRSTRVYRMGPTQTGGSDSLAPPSGPAVQRGPLRRSQRLKDGSAKSDAVPQQVTSVGSDPFYQALKGKGKSSSKTSGTGQEQQLPLNICRPERSPRTINISYTLKDLVKHSLKGIEEFILKESWPISPSIGAEREASVVMAIMKAGGKVFGLPRFGPRCVPQRDANSQYVTTILNVPNPTDIRACVRQVILTIGKPLQTAEGPRQLVTALRDVLHGLQNLFRLGYVHRDVSSGNTYIINPEDRQQLSRDAKPGEETQCEGMLADFDLCVKHRESNRKPQSHRTGTLPFMATQLFESGVSAINSPIHDMESVMWVLLWIFGHKFVQLCGKTPHGTDETLCKLLSVADTDMDTVFIRKIGFISRITKWLSPNFGSCRKLVAEAFTLVNHYYERSGEVTDKGFSDEEIEKAFSEYIDVFDRNMPSESDWSHVKGQPQDL